MLISTAYKKEEQRKLWNNTLLFRTGQISSRKDNVLVIGNFRYNKELLTDDDVQSAISHPSGRIYPKGSFDSLNNTRLS